MFGAVGGVILVIMMLITVADAIGRKFGQPVFGAHEAVSFLLGLLFFLTMVYTAVKKGHFVVDVVTTRFPPRVRLPIGTIVYLVSTMTSWAIGWQLVVYGIGQKKLGAAGYDFLFLPTYPFIWAAAFCSVILGFVFLIQTIQFISNTTERNS